MAVDFSSPFVSGAIVLKTGQRFPFWTNAGQESQGGVGAGAAFLDAAFANPAQDASTNLVSPGLESMAWIQEVNVELELSHLPIISISLAPPFRDGMAFINSELIEYGISTLEVQIGYSADAAERSLLSPVFSGIMLNPDVTIGEEIVITLQAQGTVGYALSRQSGGRVAQDGQSRAEFLQELIQGPGSRRKIEILPTPGETPPEDWPVETVELWEGGLEYAQGGKSDWLAVWEVANAANLRPFLEGNTIQFEPVANDLAREPKKIFRLYDYPQGNIGQAVDARGNFGEDTAAGVYPIIQFSSSSQPLYLPSSVRGFVLKEVSETNPRDPVEPTLVNDASEKVTRSGEGNIEPEDTEVNPELEEGTLDGSQSIPGDPDKQEEINAIRAEYWREGNMGIQVEIETIGVPDIIPGDTIVIEGVGDRFGFPRWGVFKVAHSAGLDGFTTTITAVSNTDRLLKAGKEPVGEVNTKQAELSDGTVEVLAQALDQDLAENPFNFDDSDL